MKYAVIALQGKQYKVSEGDKLTVDLLDQEVGKTFDVSDVLLLNDEGKITVGTPLVEKAKVTLKVLESGKDEKLLVGKYKSKSKYRKVIGHRQRITNLEVVKI
ncbi:MAG: 50S ribosomal protein L21 [bacterium]|nr:50S ribosomal protein L21 [bacterium]